MIHLFPLPPHHVGLAFTSAPTTEEVNRIHRALHQHGKVRSGSPVFVTKRRRLKHVLRELTRIGFDVTIEPPLVDPRSEAVDEPAEESRP